MPTLKKVIVITGTPGVGKSEVSRLLTERLGAEYLSLGEMAKNGKFVIGFDEERNTLIVDTEALKKMVSDKIEKAEHDLILDGHLSPQVVPPNHVSNVFVLRRDPNDLKGILKKRGFNRKKLKENLEAEILDVCLCEAVEVFGKDKVCEVDTTGKRLEEVVCEVLSVLQGKSPCRIGIVDWLGKLDAENRLREFLD